MPLPTGPGRLMAWAERTGSKSWRGRYYVVLDGKRYARTAGYATTRRKAEQLALDQETRLRAGTWFDPDAGKITFTEYFEEAWFPNRGGELNTRANHRSHYNAANFGLRACFGQMQLRQITNTVVQVWVARMQAAGLSAATIEGRFVTLQTVLAARKGASAMRDGLLLKNPCHGVQIPKRGKKRVEYYTPSQVDRLLEHMDPWWRPLPLLDSETGLRWGELMGIKIQDFTEDFAYLQVARVVQELTIAETGNGTRFRLKEYPKEGPVADPKVIKLPERSRRLVEGLVTARRLGPDDHLFSMPDKAPPLGWRPPLSLVWEPVRTDVWPHGLPISRNYFREAVWKPAIVAAGLPHRKFHALRASHVTWLLAGGADLAAVMARVGHSQFATTKRYTAVMSDADDRTLDALEAVRARYGSNGPRRVDESAPSEVWGYRVGDDVDVRLLGTTNWLPGTVQAFDRTSNILVELTSARGDIRRARVTNRRNIRFSDSQPPGVPDRWLEA